MDQDRPEEFCDNVVPLDQAAAGQLSAGVLCRIIKGDQKGRPFCTPRNPGTPTIE